MNVRVTVIGRRFVILTLCFMFIHTCNRYVCANLITRSTQEEHETSCKQQHFNQSQYQIPETFFVNSQIDAQLFMYVYVHSLHVSGSHVPIIKRIIVSMRHMVYVTLCR